MGTGESKMIGIELIASYVPDGRDLNLEKFPNITLDYLESIAGVVSVSKKESTEVASDLCLKALINLESKKNISTENVDLIIVISQHTKPVIPPISTELHALRDFPERTICFDLAIGCSGYVQALSVAKSYMESFGMKKALLFTVETLSDLPANDELDLLMGDAATVTLLSDDPSYLIGDFEIGTKGGSGNSLKYNGEQVVMDGVGVYNFVVRHVPSAIKKKLRDNQLELNDIDFFAFHQASKRTIDSLVRALKINPEIAPFVSRDFGNTGSCSIPLVLENVIGKNYQKVLLAGFGAGMAYGINILKKRIKLNRG